MLIHKRPNSEQRPDWFPFRDALHAQLGSDFQVDVENGANYTLEVNPGSQLMTGTFREVKMRLYGEFLQAQLLEKSKQN